MFCAYIREKDCFAREILVLRPQSGKFGVSRLYGSLCSSCVPLRRYIHRESFLNIVNIFGHFLSRVLCKTCSLIARLISPPITAMPKVVRKTPLSASM